ncbi:MAG TPA: ABC transporter ATP-binding protein [Candidatus Limnocylindrales bacterium]|nr:ABC transporter ATP-binding protein [Candidatus Limnocylindrales bacterium]
MKVVECSHLSKRFKIYKRKQNTLNGFFVNLFHPNSYEYFWALKDISFSVSQGETFGIIGRNGCGKTTLFKIISRILPPTTGTLSIEGKVSALLALGAGFHGELTGRENIYLNGSILGLSKKEIDQKIEAIIDFAEIVRPFIDTQIKHYSSGMYLRLAFAVALSVNPDILLLDEILGVGDAAFWYKCFDKITEFRDQGKTLLLISHDLSLMEYLCHRVIWIDEGVLKEEGPAKEVIDHYRQAVVPK